MREDLGPRQTLAKTEGDAGCRGITGSGRVAGDGFGRDRAPALRVGDRHQTFGTQRIGFNGGTTTSATTRHVAARTDLAEGGEQPALTIVTNALNIATELVLRPDIRTVSLGGVARPQSYEVVGPLAHQVLRELWLDHLILGVDGLSSEVGASCYHEGEASINALMVERADAVTVVAAAEKLGRRSFARICDLSAIQRIVTDSSADPAMVAAMRSRGVEVVLA